MLRQEEIGSKSRQTRQREDTKFLNIVEILDWFPKEFSVISLLERFQHSQLCPETAHAPLRRN